MTSEIEAAVEAALTDSYETPSKIGRRAKVKTSPAFFALCELVKAGKVETTGNGNWMRYRRAAKDRHVVIKVSREIATGIETHTIAASPLPLADADRAMATLAKRVAPEGFMVEYRIRSAADPMVRALATC